MKVSFNFGRLTIFLFFFMHGCQYVMIGYQHFNRGYFNSAEDILLDWKPFYISGRYFTSMEDTSNERSMKTFGQGYLITICRSEADQIIQWSWCQNEYSVYILIQLEFSNYSKELFLTTQMGFISMQKISMVNFQ